MSSPFSDQHLLSARARGSLYSEVKKQHQMFDMQSFRAAEVPPPPPPPPPLPPPPPANPEIYCHSSFFPRGGDDYSISGNSRDHTRFPDFTGELQPPVAAADFHHEDAVALSPSPRFGLKPHNNLAFVGSNLPYGSLNMCNISTYSEMGCVEESIGGGHHQQQQQQQQQLMYSDQKGSGREGQGMINTTSLGVSGSIDQNWGDSGMVMAPDNNSHSQHTDSSTDVDTDDKPHFHGFPRGMPTAVDSLDQSKTRIGDIKALRRLAQNREAARKSRLRKKAYVQQLENSRLRLLQLEQELQRARQQGMFVATGASGDHGHSAGSAVAFDMEYARWLDEHQRLISELRSAVNTQMSDNELRVLVDAVMIHYDEIFRLKSIGAKADVFHMLSGMWKTPAERCFMWLGGFRSSEILKVLGNHLEPLTDQQLVGICNLQQSSQQAEDALSQGMEALQQSLVETLSSTTLNPTGSGNVADYMGQMAIAMGKLATLENFLHQADLLRQQTLQQMHRILTTRQAARALLVINDYVSRLRALSSLWLARPRD